MVGLRQAITSVRWIVCKSFGLGFRKVTQIQLHLSHNYLIAARSVDERISKIDQRLAKLHGQQQSDATMTRNC